MRIVKLVSGCKDCPAMHNEVSDYISSTRPRCGLSETVPRPQGDLAPTRLRDLPVDDSGEAPLVAPDWCPLRGITFELQLQPALSPRAVDTDRPFTTADLADATKLLSGKEPGTFEPPRVFVPPTPVANTDTEVTVNGARWRLSWDDDELCDHVLLFDPHWPRGGAWCRVGAADDKTLWSENILPWLIVELLLERRQKREAAP